ncbi:MAG: hypothetical protein HND48_07180 [Chloroflexi bacterium]|nr:hypothetical protein [Chloroflexota bacterium]
MSARWRWSAHAKQPRLGTETARTLSTDVARSGFTIVSGLAQGIDVEAHTGALEAAGRSDRGAWHRYRHDLSAPSIPALLMTSHAAARS